MKQWLSILAGMIAVTGFGQDLKQDIAAMNAHLEALPAYRISVDYSAGDTSDFFDQGAASVLVTPGGFFYETEFAEMLINQQHTIIVNEDEHTLIWSDNAQTSKNSITLTNSVLQGIDTLITSADSVYFSSNGTRRIYHLRFNNAYFNLVELTFEGVYLTNVLYFYNETVVETPGMTAVCHVQVDEHPTYDPQLLTSDFYFVRKNGQLVPTEAFTGYVLIYNESIESSIEPE